MLINVCISDAQQTHLKTSTIHDQENKNERKLSARIYLQVLILYYGLSLRISFISITLVDENKSFKSKIFLM
jgi:hypothetical protein